MWNSRCLCWLALAVAVSGCVPSVSRQQARALSAESASLLRHAEGEIAASDWPRTVAAFAPERVHRSREGVYIQTWHFFVETHGVFILDPASSFVPAASGDPRYEPVSDGVFVYRSAG